MVVTTTYNLINYLNVNVAFWATWTPKFSTFRISPITNGCFATYWPLSFQLIGQKFIDALPVAVQVADNARTDGS